MSIIGVTHIGVVIINHLLYLFALDHVLDVLTSITHNVRLSRKRNTDLSRV